MGYKTKANKSYRRAANSRVQINSESHGFVEGSAVRKAAVPETRMVRLKKSKTSKDMISLKKKLRRQKARLTFLEGLEPSTT